MFTITNLFFFANGNGIEANQSFSWQDGLTRLTLGNLGENGQACSMEILP